VAKFEIGDRVYTPSVPFEVEVLELDTCKDVWVSECCGEMFRFKDPETGEDDWMHTDEFEKV
jgi:hypothetical protein